MIPSASLPPDVAVWIAVVLSCALLLGGVATWLALGFLRGRHRQAAREDLPERHAEEKAGTPSMGGLGLIPALVVGALIAYVLHRHLGAEARPGSGGLVFAILSLSAIFGLLGFADDYAKTMSAKAKGLRPRYRITVEAIAALAFVGAVWATGRGVQWPHHLPWPVDAARMPVWGWYSVPLGVLAIVGAANAVNLTDGLDGLAAGNVAICALGLGGVHLLQGRILLAGCSFVLAGVSLGFLWFNAHPARIWMGDTGSLALGAFLGGLAVASGLEFVLALAGIVFVGETLSVILQVIYFQSTGGKRIFRMSPFHHHLELCGWPENRIVVRSWAVTAVCSLLAWAIVAQQV